MTWIEVHHLDLLDAVLLGRCLAPERLLEAFLLIALEQDCFLSLSSCPALHGCGALER